MEDPRHASTPAPLSAPPHLTAPSTPLIPSWENLPPHHREELLRILSRMLADRLGHAAAKGGDA